MWGNYLRTGLRSLLKSRSYTFINVAGLAIGLSACLLLLAYIRHETSYDRWLPEHQRVFQVHTFGTDPDSGEAIHQRSVTRPFSDAFASDFPEVEAISKFEGENLVVLQDGRALAGEDHYAADAVFFDIVQVPFVRGERATALRDPGSLVLSRSEAIRLLGSIDVVGRTLTTVRNGQNFDMRVTGVFEDLPVNTHMSFRSVRRFVSADEAECGWGCVNGFAYVKLRQGADAETINRRMGAWERLNVPAVDIVGRNMGALFDWRLVPVTDVHLSGTEDDDQPGNDVATLITFGVVAALILGIACFNFVNLATARASQRAREVAVRKVLGAKRSQLMVQFLGESLLLTVAAMLIALTLLELTLPVFADFLEIELAVHYLGSEGLVGPVIALTLGVGLLGGLYPAFFLSRYQPSAVLKANRSAGEAPGTGRLRTALVVAQFAISIGLIVCTLIVYQQTRFARTVDPGYQRDGLLAVRGMNTPEAQAAQEVLRREIAQIPGVRSVAGTLIVPGSGRTMLTNAQVPGRSQRVEIGWYSVAPEFFDTMRMELVAGRALSRARANDNVAITATEDAAQLAEAQAIVRRGLNIVLNESAVRRLGFRSPAEALGKQIGTAVFGEENGIAPATVVGVVRDTRFRSLRQPVEAMGYYDAGIYVWLAVRYQGVAPAALREQVAAVWQRHLPTVPFDADFSDDALAELYVADDARGRTFGAFAFLAVGIACLGLFGLAAFTAERRTKEIGIRKVFGASTGQIVQLLVWQFTRPVVLANLIAWPIAWWVMRDWLNTFDTRVDLGPGPFLLAGLIALAIAIGTIAGHAIKVARANPIHALRYE